MTYLIIDIETTGLKKENQYPNIVQIAFQMISYESSTSRFYLVDEGSYNSIELKYSFIIKPNGYEISFENSLIHGITNKYALDNGVELTDVISKLNGYIHDYQPILIVHNAEFDIDILKHYGLYKYVSYFCTMKYLSEIKFKENDKYLKLTELYTTLFNKEIIQEHDALKDVEILYECFKELFALKILNEYRIKGVSNRISFQHFFNTFNKLKVLKSNVNLSDRFYGFVGLNGSSFNYSGKEIDECTYIAIHPKGDEFILSLISSSQESKLKYPLCNFLRLEYFDGNHQYSHLDKDECLDSICHDLLESDSQKRILKYRYINEFHNNLVISYWKYKIRFQNSFFIGNIYNINEKEIENYTPDWDDLWENDIIGFIDDHSLVILIKNNENKFEFCISNKMFIQETERYVDSEGNIHTGQYISTNDFSKYENSIISYFNNLAKI